MNRSALAQPSYLDYYKHINLAERAICDSNFSEAGNHYKRAFELNPQKPFSRDLLNAFYAAMDIKAYADAERYLSMLLSRGLGKGFIDKKLRAYYTGEPLQKINTILKKYADDTLHTHPLIKELNSMEKWDQDVRRYYSELNNGAYMVDSTYTIDSINAAHLFRIFKKHGVPNEMMFGNNREFNDCQTSVEDFDIIIHHHTGAAIGGRPSHTLDSFLFKAVRSLDYNANAFSYMISRNPVSNEFSYDTVTLKLPLTIDGAYFNGKIYTEYYDEQSEKRINAERRKIGLCSLDELRRKLETTHSSKSSTFQKYSFYIHITVMDAENEAQLETWLAKYGKNGTNKKSVTDVSVSSVQRIHLDYGNIYDHFIIGSSVINDYLDIWERFTREYYHGKIPYASWENRKPPLPWNYFAEVVVNPNDDLANDNGRNNHSKFIPETRILIEDSYGFLATSEFKTIELLFYKDTLIAFTANVDTTLYKLINRKIAFPNDTIVKRESVFCPDSNGIKMNLTTKTYIWKKGTMKMEFVATDFVGKDCKKRTSAIFYMTDEKKYNIYQKKVTAEKLRLEKLYGKH